MSANWFFGTLFAMSVNIEDPGGLHMDKELMELIDATMKRLDRFRFARKRIVAAALAEAANELLNDGYYDVLATNIIRDLKRKEILRRGGESWAMRKVVDQISQLPGPEDPLLLKPETDGAEAKPVRVPQLSQRYHDNEPR